MKPDLAARWLRTVASLREPALRVAFLRSELEHGDAARVAGALDAICGRTEQACPHARELLAAVVPSLADPDFAARIEALRELATREALLPLARLLRARPRAASEFPEPAVDERRLTTSATGRPLTLGERRSLARRPDRRAFDKLLLDPHPLVIQILLRNPRLTEDDLVRLVARRPAHVAAIVEVARHPSWSQRPRVRVSIVQNPGTPPEIAVPMVRLLVRPELWGVVEAADLPALVRAAAKELLERRPPVPERGAGPGDERH